jgi:hypothetical protein
MKKQITLSLLAILMTTSVVVAQTVTPLYNFETGTTQAGTYAMAWTGAPYITSYAPGTNPDAAGINATATSLNLVEVAGVNWWDNLSVFTLTTPTTITSSNRYLHIMFRTTDIAGGGFSVNLNTNALLGDPNKGTTRFDANLSANNTWQDVVIDLNYLITNNIQLSSFDMNPDLNGWGGGSGGTYNFDEIILSSSPLPRGTTFLTGNDLYDFEPGTAANITGITTSADANNPVTYPVANPYKTGMNLTANVGKRTAAATTNWWTGFGFTFANPVQVDANHKYLHIMMIAPANGQQVSFDVKQGATNVIADGLATITTANTWQDVVLDVSGMAYISGMSIKCGNWGGTAVGDYYFDEIYIDGSSAPRTNVATELRTAKTTLKAYSINKNIYIENSGAETQLNVFNINGQKIIAKHILNSETIPVKYSGLYLVKVGDQTVKVLVK